jgi:hypothetical protein
MSPGRSCGRHDKPDGSIWWCKRDIGHDGPCAASPCDSSDIQVISDWLTEAKNRNIEPWFDHDHEWFWIALEGDMPGGCFRYTFRGRNLLEAMNPAADWIRRGFPHNAIGSRYNPSKSQPNPLYSKGFVP